MKRIIRSIVYCNAIWIVFFGPSAFAADLQLKRFNAGDVIYADDVNSNFQTLVDAVKQLQQEVADLKQQNAALQAELTTLKKQPVTPAPTRTPQPAPQANTKTPKYKLRSTPQTVSETDAPQVFGLDNSRRPLQYIENDFEHKDNIVIDYATGLIWQQSGPTQELTYQEAQQYVQQLNQERFAGYTDWRLPTVEELLSLVEKTQQTNGLYLNPIFDATQRWFWSSDNQSVESAWYVYFTYGRVSWHLLRGVHNVRCVRSGQ